MKTARLLAAAMLLAAAAVSSAQESGAYPSRPVTIVVPFSAGGATDLSARVIATLLSRQLGQPFVVENRAGAGGMIGMGIVARAPADGYTLGWGGNSPMSVTPHLAKNPPYDPRTAFAPVSLAAISSWTLTSRADLPAKDFRESALPDYPTMAELGKPELTFEIFFGLVAPAGTPKAVVDKLAAAMKTAVADANYRDTMAKAGVNATSSTPDEFAALLKRHNERWLDVIKRNNISVK